MNEILNDGFFMREALKEARQAFNEDEIPIGAVVVCNGHIIAKAHNMTERLNDATAHAEMLALTAASEYLQSKYLKDCTLYVTLEPCMMCSGAALWTQISKIVFAAHDPKKGFSKYFPPPVHPKTKVISGIMEEESKTLLQKFFAQKRNKP